MKCEKCNRTFKANIDYRDHKCNKYVKIFKYTGDMFECIYKKGNEYLGMKYDGYILIEGEDGIWRSFTNSKDMKFEVIKY